MIHRLPALLALALSGCHSLWADDDLVGDGRLVDVHPAIDGEFTGVAAGNSFEVEVEIGEPEVVITLDQNIVDANLVRVAIEDGVLVVRQCDDCRDFAPSAGARVWVTAPRIDVVRALDESVVTAETNEPDVVLESSGQSRLLASTGAQTISLHASGESVVELRGSSDELVAETSGDARLESALLTRTVTISASGSSRASVHASETVVVRASGESRVTVSGEPAERVVDQSDEAAVSFQP
jgi:hypothetical protein